MLKTANEKLLFSHSKQQEVQTLEIKKSSLTIMILLISPEVFRCYLFLLMRFHAIGLAISEYEDVETNFKPHLIRGLVSSKEQWE